MVTVIVTRMYRRRKRRRHRDHDTGWLASFKRALRAFCR